MTTPTTTKEMAYQILREVHDPEIPALDIVEMGIVRDVRVDDESIEVVITPTYSGCPIMNVIGRDIVAAFREHGRGGVSVRTVYAPPWTTDWLTDEAREKLRQSGIAPPEKVIEQPLFGPNRSLENVPCPFCGSRQTDLKSEFGSTACKSLHFCNDCCQPYEHFKCI